MSNPKSTLTASNIRYLLVLSELDKNGSGVKSSDIAKCLGVSKPSVCTTIKKFCEKGYATKGKYEAVHLTVPGRQLAQRYLQQYETLYSRMERSLGLTLEGCRNAVYAILEQTSSGELPAEEKQEAKDAENRTEN